MKCSPEVSFIYFLETKMKIYAILALMFHYLIHIYKKNQKKLRYKGMYYYTFHLQPCSSPFNLSPSTSAGRLLHFNFHNDSLLAKEFHFLQTRQTETMSFNGKIENILILSSSGRSCILTIVLSAVFGGPFSSIFSTVCYIIQGRVPNMCTVLREGLPTKLKINLITHKWREIQAFLSHLKKKNLISIKNLVMIKIKSNILS